MNIYVHIAWWTYAHIFLTHTHTHTHSHLYKGVELLDHRVHIGLALVQVCRLSTARVFLMGGVLVVHCLPL